MGAPVLRLSVGTHETRVTCGERALVLWPVGTAVLWPPGVTGPSAMTIEIAIQRVEDLIDGLAGRLPEGALLEVGADTLVPLQRGGAIAAGAKGTIDRAQIEREYQALAARAIAAPSARGSEYDDPAGDALILILREFMQHLGFERLVVRD